MHLHDNNASQQKSSQSDSDPSMDLDNDGKIKCRQPSPKQKNLIQKLPEPKDGGEEYHSLNNDMGSDASTESNMTAATWSTMDSTQFYPWDPKREPRKTFVKHSQKHSNHNLKATLTSLIANKTIDETQLNNIDRNVDYDYDNQPKRSKSNCKKCLQCCLDMLVVCIIVGLLVVGSWFYINFPESIIHNMPIFTPKNIDLPLITWDTNILRYPIAASGVCFEIYNNTLYGFGGLNATGDYFLGNYTAYNTVFWISLDELLSPNTTDDILNWNVYHWQNDSAENMKGGNDFSGRFGCSSSAVASIVMLTQLGPENNTNEILMRYDYVFMSLTDATALLKFDLQTMEQVPFSDYNALITDQAYRSCIVSNNTHIFVMGGEYVNSLRIYNVENDTWVGGAEYDMHENRFDMSCSIDNEMKRIWVVGGFNENYKPLNTIECYNVAENKWFLFDTKDNITDMYWHLQFGRGKHAGLLYESTVVLNKFENEIRELGLEFQNWIDNNASNVSVIFVVGGCSYACDWIYSLYLFEYKTEMIDVSDYSYNYHYSGFNNSSNEMMNNSHLINAINQSCIYDDASTNDIDTNEDDLYPITLSLMQIKLVPDQFDEMTIDEFVENHITYQTLSFKQKVLMVDGLRYKLTGNPYKSTHQFSPIIVQGTVWLNHTIVIDSIENVSNITAVTY